MKLWQIFKIGGITMYVLLACSIVSIAIIFDRIIYFSKKSKISRSDFMSALLKKIERSGFREGLSECVRRDETDGWPREFPPL